VLSVVCYRRWNYEYLHVHTLSNDRVLNPRKVSSDLLTSRTLLIPNIQKHLKQNRKKALMEYICIRIVARQSRIGRRVVSSAPYHGRE
jgi:hypothetical protein